MTTEQKLERLVDILLVKTQDNLCEWKKTIDNKFTLRIPAFADIVMDTGYIDGNSYDIFLNVVRGDMIIASISKNQKLTEATLVRLYEYVKTYHENYVNDQLSKLMEEIQKLGGNNSF